MCVFLHTDRKLVVLSLGLLCILQAALNISLRLSLCELSLIQFHNFILCGRHILTVTHSEIQLVIVIKPEIEKLPLLTMIIIGVISGYAIIS